jgi:hypothetical protein
MSIIRPGNYLSKDDMFKYLLLAFLQLGKKTVRDNVKIIKTDESNLKLERFRRQNNFFKKFIKYERNYLSLEPLDEDHKQLGGRLKVYTKEFNFSLLQAFQYNQYGYYTNDRLVFAQFKNK